ncbi:MAG: N4-gp56 family major capsid protein [Paracoccus denitrificans]|uniref:N4-gp56 family major capsid protein n=1 Tax=Paracoccus denitrificans TaxID=266 RepID=A0A533I2D9_PARDE|nr:MAG: N4-gp56 family major capsid protein [Paracoccus denitrificans]
MSTIKTAPDTLVPGKYNDPANGIPSSIGPQSHTSFHQKEALIDAAREQYFGQLADVTNMPKNYGKKITRFHYMPMIDDRNLNDQGIDAAGATIKITDWEVTFTTLVTEYAVEAKATAAAAAINAIEAGFAVKSGSAAPWLVTVKYNYLRAANQPAAAAVVAAVRGANMKPGSGNLYGSSKDVGLIQGKAPLLSETGGRVNRVGFTRKLIEGTLEKYGIFREYTQESLDFDSDADLDKHINREMIRGANDLTEAMLQADLLNAAGVIRFAGGALKTSELSKGDVVTYADLIRLDMTLTDNRSPRKINMITGSRMIDTRTIMGARALYIGSELLPTIYDMKDNHGKPAFISIEKYAAAGNTLRGEVGSVGPFRLIVVPEMQRWSGAGAPVEVGDGAHFDNGTRYDVFPMLTIGSEAFTTIGFQTDGKTVKFVITAKKPGRETADRMDPYGEMGFMSIKWYYGFMVLRPEWIGIIKTLAVV